MREFLSMIIMPLPILFLLLLAAFIFFKLNRKQGGRLLLWTSGIWFLIITTAPVPKGLVKSLETQYTQISDTVLKELFDSCDIIVLGSGHSDDKNLSPNNQLTKAALGRLIEGIRIHRLIPGSRLILSGYKGTTELPQALVLYRTALQLGVDSASMSMLPLPINTRMEAEEYIKNFGKRNNLVLVTCAIHMPRAMKLFKKAGLNPIPGPTNFILKQGLPRNSWKWVPSPAYTNMMEAAVHEYVGMLWMFLGGN